MVLLLVARPLISGVLSFLEFIWFFVLIIVVDHRLKRLIDFLVISVLKTTRGDNFISVFETPLFGVPEVRFLRYSVEHVLGLLSIFLSFIRPVKLYHFLLLLFLIPFICISGRFLNTIFNLRTLLLLKSLLLNLSLVFDLGGYHIDHVFGYFSVIFCGPWVHALYYGRELIDKLLQTLILFYTQAIDPTEKWILVRNCYWYK